jgi:hypothetical protein
MNFFSKHKSSLNLVFDIRDSSISVAAARFEKGKKPELVLCKNAVIEYNEASDYKKYLASMLKTLDALVIDMIKNLRKIGNVESIHQYLFFIGSPWSVSTTKLIKVLKDVPFEVNDALLGKIITSEEVSARKEIEQDLNEKNWAVLEEKIIQSKLNGYPVKKIFGRKITSLEVELFVSFTPHEIKNHISTFMDQKFGTHRMKYSNSSIIASYTFLKDFYPYKNNFLYIDIGSMVTDISIVRDGIIYGIASFPFGRKDVLKKALTATDMSEEIVLSYIHAKNDGHGDVLKQKDLEKSIVEGIDIWNEKLREAVGKICIDMNMPNYLFFMANSELAIYMIKKMSNVPSNESFTVLGMGMNIGSVSEGVLNSAITNAKTFVGELHIKMDLLFVDKMIH